MKKTLMILICVMLCMFAFTAGVSAVSYDQIPVLENGDSALTATPLSSETNGIIMVDPVSNNVARIDTLNISNAVLDPINTKSYVVNNVGYIDIFVAESTADNADITLEIASPTSVIFGNQSSYEGEMGTYRVLANSQNKASFTLENGRFVGKITVKNGVMSGASYVITIKKTGDNNQSPVLAGDAVAKSTLTLGKEYSLDLASVFIDPDKDELNYTVSVNGGEAEEITSPYKLNPEAIGSYTLKFVANDGQLSSPVYTVSLIVLSDDAKIFDVSTARGYSGANNTIYLDTYIKEMAVSGGEVSRLKTIGAVYIPTIEFWLAPDTAKDAEIVIMITDDSVDGTDMKFRQIKCTAGSVVSPALKEGSELLTETSASLKIKLSDGEFSSSFYTDSGGSSVNLKVHVATQEELDANNAPVLGDGYVSGETNIVKVGFKTSFDLLKMFTDKDHDVLTYTVKENDGEAKEILAPDFYSYEFVAKEEAKTTLTFTASDGKETVSYSTTFDVKTAESAGIAIVPSKYNNTGHISKISVYGVTTQMDRMKAYLTNLSANPSWGDTQSKGVIELLLHPDTAKDSTFYVDLEYTKGNAPANGSFSGIKSNADDKGTITNNGDALTCTLADGELNKEILILFYPWNTDYYKKSYYIKAHIATEEEWNNHEPLRKEGVAERVTKQLTVDALDENADDTLTVNLDEIFGDEDSNKLNYTVTTITKDANGREVSTTEQMEGSTFTKEYGPDDAGEYVYRFNAADKYEDSPDSYTVVTTVTVNEHRPCIAEKIEASATTDFKNTVYTVADEAFVLDLTKVFSDPDEGDTLTYTVAVAKEGEEAAEPVDAAAQYSFKPTEAGKYELTFSALDSRKYESRNQYIVTLYVGTVGENAVAVKCDAWPELKYLSFYEYNSSTPLTGNKVTAVTYDEESKALSFDLELSENCTGKSRIAVGFCYQPGADAAPYLSSGTFARRSSALNPSLANNEISGNKSTKYFESKDAETNKFSIVVNGHVVHENNGAPAVKDGVENTASAKLLPDDTYSLNLANIFADPENDKLTYTVSVDGAEEITAKASYSISFDTPGTYELKFYAADYEKKSEAYTVSVNVRDAAAVPTNTSAIGSNDKWVEKILVIGANVGKYEWTANDDTAAKAAGYTQEANDAVKEKKLITANYDNEVTIYLSSTTALDAEIDLIFNYGRKGHTSLAGHNSAHRFNSDEFTYLGGAGNTNFGETVVTYAAPEPLKLVDGKGTYYYRIHSVVDTTWTYPHNYKINFVVATDNNVPVVAEDAVSSKELKVGQTFELDLSTIFSDADEADTLTYTVSKNGAKAVVCEAAYADTSLTEEGTYEYVFTAIDDWGDRVSHTVTVTVVSESYTYNVNIPAGFYPAFYGVDAEGVLSESQLGSSAAAGENGFTAYAVNVPKEYTAIAVADIDEVYGKVILETKDAQGVVLSAASLRPLDVEVNAGGLTADHVEITVTDPDGKALAAGSSEVKADGTIAAYYLVTAGEGEYTVSASANGDFASDYETASVKVTADAVSSAAVKAELTLEISAAAKDKAAAKVVEDAICALPAAADITVDDEAAVVAAREAYNALTDDQKALVSNEATLIAAEEAVAAAKTAADQAAKDAIAAKAVAEQIEELPAADAVEVGDTADIRAAREAYNALTDAQKALVENEAKLIAAEEALAALGEWWFIDVADDAYYYDAVKWAVENGITNGMGNNMFKPDFACTRGQVVTFLWRAAGEPIPFNTENPFTDLDEDAYYYNAVLWAVENGITNGMGNNEFKPDMTCTRGQIVTFQYRAAGAPEVSGGHPFTDVETGSYYENAVIWAVANGITTGTSATTFNPDDDCLRCQIVTFLYRAR